MNSFKLEEIYGDGYERWAKVTECSSNIENLVHFLEYDEYLENGNNTGKRRKGDIINGNIKIDLVTKYKLIDNAKSGFVQSIDNSSNITAIGKVKEIEDSDTLICSINNLGENIMVEFENDIDIKVGETLEISGSLELEIE
ncbi:hypothetical protein [Clostridium saccharobutylicum]|uniref:Uncharacterized protein n=1 Tax=Clostridium saccharobutylicum DSM 13864 TaxID=1345695 RepID=U5MUN6_CLOSA|nr:hypothetical protein [Clostridium saccharobutylicum]AGX44479.1 hypothetical protein CLSA_c35180 [Clostridium saccharobutylicum DSM 13864]AQR91774.1 hypothetical protein CLOSC_35020 [Clostridium saccharobutylicum]AQS01676.1 hypothetical protein CSACC_35070 [Clostridium saccharobutylicum]AQS15659.1 hypothetical protein CLOSACC_35070 [Clostridium saccharobutylicum]MBA2907435.1 ribosomal protein L2 [Clostridium saccharobutylicum]